MLYRLVIIYLALSPLLPTYAGVKLSSLPIFNLNRLLGILLIFVLVSNGLISRSWLDQTRSRLNAVRKPVMLVSMFFAWKLITAFTSEDVSYSFFLAFIDILLQFSIFISVVVAFHGVDDVDAGLRSMLYGASVVVFFGLVEFAMKQNIFAFLAPSGSENVDYIATAIGDKTRDTYRVQCAFMHPLVLAEYLIMILPLSAHYLKHGVNMRICSLFVMIGGALVVFATGSRSGIIVMGVQALTLFMSLLIDSLKYKRSKNSIIIVAFAMVALLTGFAVAYIYGIDLVVGRSGAESESSLARLTQLNNGFKAMVNKPIVGCGPGLAVKYASVENIATGQLSVDNYFLSLVVDSGIPALFLFCMILYSFFRLSRRLHHSRSGYASYGFISYSLLGFTVFCTILSTYEVFGFAFALMGILLVIQRSQSLSISPSLCKGSSL